MIPLKTFQKKANNTLKKSKAIVNYLFTEIKKFIPSAETGAKIQSTQKESIQQISKPSEEMKMTTNTQEVVTQATLDELSEKIAKADKSVKVANLKQLQAKKALRISTEAFNALNKELKDLRDKAKKAKKEDKDIFNAKADILQEDVKDLQNKMKKAQKDFDSAVHSYDCAIKDQQELIEDQEIKLAAFELKEPCSCSDENNSTSEGDNDEGSKKSKSEQSEGDDDQGSKESKSEQSEDDDKKDEKFCEKLKKKMKQFSSLIKKALVFLTFAIIIISSVTFYNFHKEENKNSDVIQNLQLNHRTYSEKLYEVMNYTRAVEHFFKESKINASYRDWSEEELALSPQKRKDIIAKQRNDVELQKQEWLQRYEACAPLIAVVYRKMDDIDKQINSINEQSAKFDIMNSSNEILQSYKEVRKLTNTIICILNPRALNYDSLPADMVYKEKVTFSSPIDENLTKVGFSKKFKVNPITEKPLIEIKLIDSLKKL